MNQNTIYITCLEFFFKTPIQGRNQGFSKQQLHDYHMTNHMANHMTNNMIVIKQRKAYKYHVICDNGLCGMSLDIWLVNKF